jgi:hypothetical protein
MAEAMNRKLIPSLREGIDLIKVIFYKELKAVLLAKYPLQGAAYAGMLAGAMLNELFHAPNPEEKFRTFAAENRERITRELGRVGREMPEFRILLTDALRMHFLCNQQEGIDVEEGAGMLQRAKDHGILLAERDVPLPKGFMDLVYRVGRARGFVVEQPGNGG